MFRATLLFLILNISIAFHTSPFISSRIPISQGQNSNKKFTPGHPLKFRNERDPIEKVTTDDEIKAYDNQLMRLICWIMPKKPEVRVGLVGWSVGMHTPRDVLGHTVYFSMRWSSSKEAFAVANPKEWLAKAPTLTLNLIHLLAFVIRTQLRW